MQIEQFIKILERSYLYSPFASDEDIMIDYWDPDTGSFGGQSHEGEYYYLELSDVDFEKDSFFELKKISIDSVA